MRYMLILAVLLLGASAAQALPQGVIVSGQAWIDSGYSAGWQPLFWIPQKEMQWDPGEWLYATKLSNTDAQFGQNTTHTGPRTAWAHDGVRTEFVGSQAYSFDFDVYPSDAPRTWGSALYRLELWGWEFSYPGQQEELLWASNGPWTTPGQHVNASAPGVWWYEFRLVTVPEPSSLAAMVGLIAAVFVRRRRGC